MTGPKKPSTPSQAPQACAFPGGAARAYAAAPNSTTSRTWHGFPRGLRLVPQARRRTGGLYPLRPGAYLAAWACVDCPLQASVRRAILDRDMFRIRQCRSTVRPTALSAIRWPRSTGEPGRMRTTCRPVRWCKPPATTSTAPGSCGPATRPGGQSAGHSYIVGQERAPVHAPLHNSRYTRGEVVPGQQVQGPVHAGGSGYRT